MPQFRSVRNIEITAPALIVNKCFVERLQTVNSLSANYVFITHYKTYSLYCNSLQHFFDSFRANDAVFLGFAR